MVSGYFDPMLASMANRLSEIKREGKPLLVLVANPLDPILPARARMELVAGLAVVNYVCETVEDLACIQLEQEHSSGFVLLLERVHQRQAL